MSAEIVFVGQGPNSIAWETALEWGRRMLERDTRGRDVVSLEEAERMVYLRAETYCQRIALTGSVGTRIGRLLGLSAGEFMRAYERRNLNRRWNGKSGKGDVFNRLEARTLAQDVLEEGFSRIVCVGAEVGAAFGVGKLEQLGERGRYIPKLVGGKIEGERYVTFFLLPHPSGIVQWWNDDFNRFRAEKRLREFLGSTPNAQTHET